MGMTAKVPSQIVLWASSRKRLSTASTSTSSPMTFTSESARPCGVRVLPETVTRSLVLNHSPSLRRKVPFSMVPAKRASPLMRSRPSGVSCACQIGRISRGESKKGRPMYARLCVAIWEAASVMPKLANTCQPLSLIICPTSSESLPPPTTTAKSEGGACRSAARRSWIWVGTSETWVTFSLAIHSAKRAASHLPS